MNLEFWYHGAELIVLLLGVVLPVLRSTGRLSSMLKDFPLHRHSNGSILYPAGYEPPAIERTKQ